MAVTPLQFLGGVSLVAVPLAISGVVARPTFANAIKSKLDQERIEAQRQHNYKTDYYTPNEKQDKLIKRYLETGSGNARDQLAFAGNPSVAAGNPLAAVGNRSVGSAHQSAAPFVVPPAGGRTPLSGAPAVSGVSLSVSGLTANGLLLELERSTENGFVDWRFRLPFSDDVVWGLIGDCLVYPPKPAPVNDEVNCGVIGVSGPTVGGGTLLTEGPCCGWNWE